ncbi:hypothetical protein GCWB2_11180 [Gordonia rubripertincta]|nr:hypothetical protein GCWB2_11180 [Gordonia rubripertincta]
MPIRRSSIVLIVLGVILVVLAALTKFVVEPSVSKMPTSLDVTNTFTGTGTLLNAAAVQAGDMQNAVARDVPVSVVRHTYVSDSEGDTAIVHDDFTVNAPNGVSLPTNHTYAIDRTTMGAADAPTGQQVEEHEGLTIGLPINPDAGAEYTLYDFATQSTFPMISNGSSTVAGREVLNYTVTARGPLKDPAIAGGLPPALPKEQIAQIAALLPPSTRDQITAALPSLPNPVPISYTADSTLGLSADATLGTPVDGTLK